MSPDPWRLDGRVALVTGAGRGLGRGCAVELAHAGATVVIVSRTESELKETVAAAAAAGGEARPVVADMSDEQQVASVVQQATAAGDLRVLVTAAGINRPGPARDYPTEDWDVLFRINVRAMFLACRAFGDALLTRGTGGSIVNISSQLGSVGYPGRVAYCATKHAVDGMTRALAVEWAKLGIRVNAVAPTFVETKLTKQWLDDQAFREELLKHRLPTGRLAEIDDVAEAVAFLVSDAARNITGTVLTVDAGSTA